MATNKNFEYLGSTFQLQLLNQIILDKDFGRSIIDVIQQNYFENRYFKIIIQMVKEYYLKYDHTPSFETLEQITKSELQQEIATDFELDITLVSIVICYLLPKTISHHYVDYNCIYLYNENDNHYAPLAQ